MMQQARPDPNAARPKILQYRDRFGRTVTALEIARAADILKAGGVVAFPTETVYGLGADAASAPAVAKIYQLKGRPADHPVIVHLGPTHPLERWAREVPAS